MMAQKEKEIDVMKLARGQRHIALLKRVEAGKTLSVKAMAELEELEAAWKAKNAPKPKPKKKPATVEKRPRRRSLSRKYRDHLEQVAAIFVACNENALQAAEQVRERIPELPRFSDRAFFRWADNGQWQVELKAARENAKFEKELAAAKRSKNFIRWAMERVIELKAEHEQLRSENAEAGAAKRKAEINSLEVRIVKLNEAMRAEETHLGRLERKLLDGTDEVSVTVTFQGRADETESAK